MTGPLLPLVMGVRELLVSSRGGAGLPVENDKERAVSVAALQRNSTVMQVSGSGYLCCGSPKQSSLLVMN